MILIRWSSDLDRLRGLLLFRGLGLSQAAQERVVKQLRSIDFRPLHLVTLRRVGPLIEIIGDQALVTVWHSHFGVCIDCATRVVIALTLFLESLTRLVVKVA